MLDLSLPIVVDMQFPERLARLRKEKRLTQQVLADMTGISLIQIHRYENGGSQPSLEALRKLAKGLSVSADTLVFECVGDADGATPSDPVSITISVTDAADTGEDTPPVTEGGSGDAGAPVPDESPAPTDEPVPTDGDAADAGGDTGDTTDAPGEASPPGTEDDNGGRPDTGRSPRGGGRGGR